MAIYVVSEVMDWLKDWDTDSVSGGRHLAVSLYIAAASSGMLTSMARERIRHMPGRAWATISTIQGR
jgi:hypothetical protein